jgi:hypothetical protein
MSCVNEPRSSVKRLVSEVRGGIEDVVPVDSHLQTKRKGSSSEVVINPEASAPNYDLTQTSCVFRYLLLSTLSQSLARRTSPQKGKGKTLRTSAFP